jgi:hypothetical protein
MAPIICKIVNSERSGICGIKVILECKDHNNRPYNKFGSYSDERGDVNSWFSFPPVGTAGDLCPHVIHMTRATRVSICFILDIDDCPRVGLQQQIHLSDLTRTHFTLLIDSRDRHPTLHFQHGSHPFTA